MNKAIEKGMELVDNLRIALEGLGIVVKSGGTVNPVQKFKDDHADWTPKQHKLHSEWHGGQAQKHGATPTGDYHRAQVGLHNVAAHTKRNGTFNNGRDAHLGHHIDNVAAHREKRDGVVKARSPHPGQMSLFGAHAAPKAAKKPETGGKGREGLVAKKVTVQRGGRSHQQTVYVRPGDEKGKGKGKGGHPFHGGDHGDAGKFLDHHKGWSDKQHKNKALEHRAVSADIRRQMQKHVVEEGPDVDKHVKKWKHLNHESNYHSQMAHVHDGAARGKRLKGKVAGGNDEWTEEDRQGVAHQKVSEVLPRATELHNDEKQGAHTWAKGERKPFNDREAHEHTPESFHAAHGAWSAEQHKGKAEKLEAEGLKLGKGKKVTGATPHEHNRSVELYGEAAVHEEAHRAKAKGERDNEFHLARLKNKIRDLKGYRETTEKNRPKKAEGEEKRNVKMPPPAHPPTFDEKRLARRYQDMTDDKTLLRALKEIEAGKAVTGDISPALAELRHHAMMIDEDIKEDPWWKKNGALEGKKQIADVRTMLTKHWNAATAAKDQQAKPSLQDKLKAKVDAAAGSKGKDIKAEAKRQAKGSSPKIYNEVEKFLAASGVKHNDSGDLVGEEHSLIDWYKDPSKVSADTAKRIPEILEAAKNRQEGVKARHLRKLRTTGVTQVPGGSVKVLPHHSKDGMHYVRVEQGGKRTDHDMDPTSMTQAHYKAAEMAKDLSSAGKGGAKPSLQDKVKAKVEEASEKQGGKSHPVRGFASSVFDVEIAEHAKDPQFLEPDDRRGFQLLHEHHKGGRLHMPDNHADSMAMWRTLVDLSNGQDEIADGKTGADPEQRRQAKGASTGLGTLSGKVLAHAETLKKK